MMDSSYERTSHVEPLPMDGGDWPAQLPQMDLNYETPSRAEPPLPTVGEDWRTQLLLDSRQRIVNKILDTLRRHLPVSHEAGLQELRKIAVRFEEKIYSAATSQSDYLRKISLKMLTMESKSQTSSGSSSGNQRQQQLERIADNTEQNMRAGVISQMIILEDDLDESKSQSILLNALHSNSTDMNGNLPELEPTNG